MNGSDALGVTVKGIREGLLITLGPGDWAAGLQGLESYLDAHASFFRGGRVALDVGERRLTREELQAAVSLLSLHQVELWAVVGADPVTRAAAQELGLITELTLPRVTRPPREEATAPDEESATEGLIVRRTLRSGQSLRHPGHIVVIGDVNVGAEVIAGGHIVVWGRARGLLHAGALGDEGAVVCALDLSPTQLRIASHIARSPEERRRNPVPEMAIVQEGRIVAIPWQGSTFKRAG
ncbi:MAG: septum site-determining protein MinC [Anaerolineae bacterium]|nr:septum site-determining protein MinC [Anaerolineae bacterium]